MNIKPQTVLPPDVTVTLCEPGKAQGLESNKMRAKGGDPANVMLLRGQAEAIRVIKQKARIARAGSEDVARALAFLKYGM